MVGIDHAFSFPLCYFATHDLKPDWPAFLDDFQHHWPTEGDDVWVRDVRSGRVGDAARRMGSKGCFRSTELRTKTAKSVFNFDQKQGCVAFSTHAGIPWLRFIRGELGSRVHFWPFDGWKVANGRSAIVEVYPALWKHLFPYDNRTADQHDAFCIAAWLARADTEGRLSGVLNPPLSPAERAVAQVEGWILGVLG